jgi:long-chain acyl-CoA synthetase
MGVNVAQLLDQSARRAGDRVALRLGETAHTYTQLDVDARRLAGHLRATGMRAGARVGLMLPNVPQFPIAYHGALRAGAVVVPMNTMLRPREVAYYLEDAGAEILVVWHEQLAEALEAARRAGVQRVISVGGPSDSAPSLEQILADGPVDDFMAQRRPDDPAVVLYTSGTTGRPKGALLTHSNMLWNAQVSAELHGIGADDRLLGTLPLFHSFGQTCVLNAGFRRGAEIVLISRFAVENVLTLLERHDVTVFIGVPTMYVALLNAESAAERSLPALRLCVSGGSAIPIEILRAFEDRFGCRVLEGYGLSETSPVASFNHMERPSKPGSIGTPVWGTEMRVTDGFGQTLPPGEVGEIQIRGHNVMAGYHARPRETAEAIDPDGWLHTGDLARMDEDGYFFIVDRKKDLIIRGGYNVYPREIEEVLYEHPQVMEAAVLGIPDPELGEEVAAAVVPRPGTTIDPEALKAWVREQVAPYKYPRHVAIVAELPKGPSGKILKRELPDGLFGVRDAPAR